MVPSMEMTSPSLTVVTADGEPPAAASTSSASAPQTQVLPMPRATTAAWRGLAAAAR